MSCKKDSIRNSGFTLIELSMSLLIISLISASVVATLNQKARVDNANELNRKLDAIGEALYNYRILNNKLPCPSDSSLARTSSYFGLQANGADGTCSVGAGIASNVNTTGSPPQVYGGGVPVRTLGLTDDIAYDPWGNEFTYYVRRDVNIATNFANGTEGISNNSNLQVYDESGASLGSNIFATIISHGPNGHGAYNIAGVRINSNVSNERELLNCMCGEDASAASVATLSVYLQRTLPTSYANTRTNFDDVGRYYPRGYFYTPAEKNR